MADLTGTDVARSTSDEEQWAEEEDWVGQGGGGGGGHHHHHNKQRKGTGLLVRIRPIHGLTPKKALRKTLHFPAVTSDPFEVIQTGMHTDYQTVSSGEYSMPTAGRKAAFLETSTFDILALSWDARWLGYRDVDPHDIKKALTRIVEYHCPVHLIAQVNPHVRGHPGPEWDTYVTLRSVSRRLPHGEPDTRYYTVEWKEYREPGIGRRHKGHKHGHGNKGHKLPTTHKLKAGDTLRKLAQEYFGNGTQWRVIARANHINKWGSNDPLVDKKRFKVGDRIKIPKRPGKHDSGNGGTPPPGRKSSSVTPDDGLFVVEGS